VSAARPSRPARAPRNPRYVRFLVVGAVAGAVVGVVSALVRGGDQTGQQVAYSGCFLALLGALILGALAILLDRPERPAAPAEDPAEEDGRASRARGASPSSSPTG
jgi:hypothetical protein